ncbi:MAG: pyruvate kinase [Lachnospiraceae bacterium]|nr:pyruvate kinase [Lachnospiraceae bacterium]
MIKIYGTLGPSCSDAETLCQMFKEGMTGVRLNLSHVTLRDAAGQIDELHKAAIRAGVSTDLLIDMQGPELRTGALKEPVLLKEGTEVFLYDKDNSNGMDQACSPGVPVPAITLPYLIPEQQVLIDDGKLLLEVTSASGRACAAARVIRGGILRSRKSMALPGTDIEPPTLTATDLINIRDAAEFGVTGLMQPFVRSAADLKAVRKALTDAGADHIRLLAKIENHQGTDHIRELLPYADEFVIARGDLGNSMPLWELPAVQKQLAHEIKAAGKDLMIVTQMLASMEHAAVPTRAEVLDIFNAVLDGADSCMVTGETAVGEYPVDVIRYLAKTAAEGERWRNRGI